ncbi:cytochrome P450 27C1 isoform X1 [Alligator mississippiensis]|uniref:cytochrome P450 27C1 isoform X1 n=2 Tax=Alligator mississippiensis TaxID=8496 RepID=UPI0003D0899F|nr:cytochrome P450 27C1 isoform X1 [Alligator mississippiensis]
MSLLLKVLKTNCKQALEPERWGCFYRVVFVCRFQQLPKMSSSPALEVQNNPAAKAAAEDKEEEMAVAEGAGGLLKPAQHHRHHHRVRSLQEMPGPNLFCNLYEFFWKDGFSRIHEIQQKHTQEYGKIFKSHFGFQFVVSIADRDMVAQVLRAEGRAPQRANMESWQEYRDLRGRATGLISAEGDQWLKMRKVLRQKILKPEDVSVFSGPVNEVITDLIKRIHTLKRQEEDGETVTDVNNLFFKYSMEGVATILYECRLGCLENSVPEKTVEYIEALALMFSVFKTAMYSGVIPKWLRPLIPKPWNVFCRSWDGLFKFSQIHVDNKLKDIQSRLEHGEEVKGGLLTYLLLSKELTLEEIYANMTEMLLAGVDTTSFTLSWVTFLLAKHPEVQQSVYEEIVNKLGKDHVPTADDVPKLPMIRAVLKETLRLFPVLPGNGRVTQEDLIVGGYLIPKGTQLALCHYATSYDEENFPMANEFQPERWLRKDHMDRVDNFGSIPFGYGIRSCIGKRIAELEIHLVLIQLLQNFEIKISSKTKPVRAKTHGLLTPGDSINVKFANRK